MVVVSAREAVVYAESQRKLCQNFDFEVAALIGDPIFWESKSKEPFSKGFHLSASVARVCVFLLSR